MLFSSRLILSSEAISVILSGKMEKLLLARLMQVKCSIPPTASGSLVRTFPRRSNSANIFQDKGVNRGVACLLFRQHLWGEQACEINNFLKIESMNQMTAVLLSTIPLSWGKVEKTLLETDFNSLSARVITRMLSETLLRTLNTPSGKEMSLQFDRSAEKKEMIMRLWGINAEGECWISIINTHMCDLKLFEQTILSLCHHLLVKYSINQNIESGLFIQTAGRGKDVWREFYLMCLSHPRRFH